MTIDIALITGLTPIYQILIILLYGLFIIVSISSRFFSVIGDMIWNVEIKDHPFHIISFTVLLSITAKLTPQFSVC